ncbi:MAG: 4-amino-4-deoxy-L-arabinose transferase-like protein glycosyltransferase of PMT family, partial [uncultured bacterium]
MLAGLSFISKGPVSFYTLLLPFLLSEFINGDMRKYLQHRKMLLLSVIIALLTSIAWPAYLLYTVPEEIRKIALTEINSWGSRHVKSILWYLQFPATTGIWVFFALPALWFPHSRQVTEKRFPTSKITTWIILGFILLTIIPEKKDRYLLPLAIPLAALLGGYITALMNRQSDTNKPSHIIRVYNFLSAAFLLITTATGLYYSSSYGFNLYIVFISLASVAMLVRFSRILREGQQPDLIYIILSFVMLTQVVGPLASRRIGPDNFM